MLGALLLGTIPVGITGLLFNDAIETHLRSFEVVAYATIFFGIMLGLSDWVNRSLGKSREMIQGMDILVIGCFQALALIPGTSRSGITITAALFIGLIQRLVNQICIPFVNSSDYSCNNIKNN